MEAKERKLEFEGNDITIEWRPDLCIHSGNCTFLLPEVYNRAARVWIRPNNADTESLINQIDCCPTGALSYRHNKK